MSERRDDQLDALLMEQSSYIEDDGFTEQVMSALPPAQPATGHLGHWIVMASALLAALLGLVLLPGGDYLRQAGWQLLTWQPQELMSFPIIPLAATLLLLAGGAAAAVSD